MCEYSELENYCDRRSLIRNTHRNPDLRSSTVYSGSNVAPLTMDEKREPKPVPWKQQKVANVVANPEIAKESVEPGRADTNLPQSNGPVDTAVAPSVDSQGTATDAKSLKISNLPLRKRRLQHVTTLADRSAIILWMREQEALGEKKIPSKAVRAFPNEFRGSNNSNLMKASRWFKLRNEPQGIDSSMSSAGPSVRRKAAPGRGRKKTPWAAALTEDVRREVLKLQNAGVKITNAVVKTLACSILVSNSRDEYSSDLVPKITSRWVQRFMLSHPMFSAKQGGPQAQKKSSGN